MKSSGRLPILAIALEREPDRGAPHTMLVVPMNRIDYLKRNELFRPTN